MTFTFARPTRKCSVTTVALAASVLLANGGDVSLQNDDSAAAARILLSAIDAHQAAVTDLHASFTQTVYSPSIQRSETQKGRVWVRRPGLMRWEYDGPTPSVVTADGEALRLYSPEDAQLQIHSLGGVFSQKALGLLMGEGGLSDDFVAQALPDAGNGEKRVRLVPKDGSFTSLELAVAPGTYELRASTFIDPFGQQTQLRFHDLVENSGVSDERFQLNVPEDTEVFDLRGAGSP